jgi:hypothetical protein
MNREEQVAKLKKIEAEYQNGDCSAVECFQACLRTLDQDAIDDESAGVAIGDETHNGVDVILFDVFINEDDVLIRIEMSEDDRSLVVEAGCMGY